MTAKSPATRPGWRAWALLLAAAAYLFALYYLAIVPHQRETDLGRLYVWGYAARHGLDPYRLRALQPIAKLLHLEAILNNYPPLDLIVFEPLSQLPVSTAFWIWSATDLALLLTGLAIVIRSAGERGSPVALLALALLYGPVADTLYWGNSDVVVLVLLALSFQAIRSSSDLTCGISLALAALWKGFPAAILAGYLVSDRRPRLLLAASLTLLVGFVVSFIVFGPNLNWEFVHAAFRTGGSELLQYGDNGSFAALITRAAGWAAGTYPDAPWRAVRVAALLAVEAVFFMFAMHGASIASRSGRPEFAFALWVAWLLPMLTVVWFLRLSFFLVVLLLLARADGVSNRARYAGLATYILAETGVVIKWIDWLAAPANDAPLWNLLGAVTSLAMVSGFSAAYLMCADSRPAS